MGIFFFFYSCLYFFFTATYIYKKFLKFVTQMYTMAFHVCYLTYCPQQPREVSTVLFFIGLERDLPQAHS